MRSATKLRYFISYGFTEGRAHSRSLRRALYRDGFEPAASIQAADIIIAHSAGCWFIEPYARGKLVLLVGAPLHDGHRLRITRQSRHQIHLAYKHHTGRIVKNTLYSWFYALLQPRRNTRIIHRAAKLNPLEALPDNRVIFIMNRHDPWPHSSYLDHLLATKNLIYLSLPGAHDDIWYAPEHYVAIIKFYAGLLAKTGV